MYTKLCLFSLCWHFLDYIVLAIASMISLLCFHYIKKYFIALQNVPHNTDKVHTSSSHYFSPMGRVYDLCLVALCQEKDNFAVLAKQVSLVKRQPFLCLFLL
jgi:hypothetical protein